MKEILPPDYRPWPSVEEIEQELEECLKKKT